MVCSEIERTNHILHVGKLNFSLWVADYKSPGWTVYNKRTSNRPSRGQLFSSLQETSNTLLTLHRECLWTNNLQVWRNFTFNNMQLYINKKNTYQHFVVIWQVLWPCQYRRLNNLSLWGPGSHCGPSCPLGGSSLSMTPPRERKDWMVYQGWWTLIYEADREIKTCQSCADCGSNFGDRSRDINIWLQLVLIRTHSKHISRPGKVLSNTSWYQDSNIQLKGPGADGAPRVKQDYIIVHSHFLNL